MTEEVIARNMMTINVPGVGINSMTDIIKNPGKNYARQKSAGLDVIALRPRSRLFTESDGRIHSFHGL